MINKFTLQIIESYFIFIQILSLKHINKHTYTKNKLFTTFIILKILLL